MTEPEYSTEAKKVKVFIREDHHRRFAVLDFMGKEQIERIPLQFFKMSDEARKRHMEKVTDRLMKRAGLKV